MTGEDLLKRLLKLREENPEALKLDVAASDDLSDGANFFPEQIAVMYCDEDASYYSDGSEDPDLGGHRESHLVLFPL